MFDCSSKNLVVHQPWHDPLVYNFFTFLSCLCLTLCCFCEKKSEFDQHFCFLRSPDLTSSRDDDDSGYNSTKADEVSFCYYSTFIHTETLF